MSSSTLKTGAIVLFTIFLVAGMAVVPAAASNTAINYDADAAPQPQVVGDVTIADHPVGEDPLTYNNNDGEWVPLDASVNSSVDNPYEFVPTDVNFSDAGAFPHEKEDVSALTASEWSTDVSSSDGTMSVSDTETASDVEAVQISTSGQTTGPAIATFGNFSITSDEEKRYLQIAMDVNTLDSGATVDVRAVDEDGDYYNATIDPGQTEGENYITNATGEGIVYQAQLGELSMTQNGDGTFNDIQKVEIHVDGADADVEISALNLDKMGAWDLGDKLEDTDDDDELETVEITEHKTGGSLALSDLSAMGGTFDSAHIKGLTVPFEMGASDLDSEDVDVGFSPADQYSNYESHFEGDFRFELPEQYDLSYANLELEDTQSLPDSRYVSVEYAEGTGDTEFSEIESWSSISSSYSSIDSEISVDDTVQPGTAMVLSYDYVVTSEEQTNLEDTGAVMGPMEEDGGIIDWLLGVPGMILAAGAMVVQKARGAFPFSG